MYNFEPHHQDGHRKEVLIVDLSDYEIYKSPNAKLGAYELTSLHLLDVKAKELYFDGILSLRSTAHYVQLSYIEDYSVEGYDDDQDPTTTIFIQTREARKDSDFDIWYRLSTECASSYQRFQKPFRWIADFGKHALDYMALQPNGTTTLMHFKDDFHAWLTNRFVSNPAFTAWKEVFQKTDFRVAFHAYVDFIQNQAHNLSNSKSLLSHPIWADCLRGERYAIQEQPILCEKTIATPMVYRCFRNMYFGQRLEEMAPSESVRRQQNSRKQLLGFPEDLQYKSKRTSLAHSKTGRQIAVGDVVGLRPDGKTWNKSRDATWMAYVQRIEMEGGEPRLYLLWLYRPSDTVIDQMVYPHEKEMFLSDNCNCGQDEEPIYVSDVVSIYSADWSPKSLNTDKDVFIRTKYVTRDDAFVTLESGDFKCSCQEPKTSFNYQESECVYINVGVHRKGQKILEPVVIASHHKLSNQFTVRRFLRLQRDCFEATDSMTYTRKELIDPYSKALHSLSGVETSRESIAWNELVWTEELFRIDTERIERKCNIRFFPVDIIASNQVPVPYSRHGNGDFWFFSSSIISINGRPQLEHLDSPPKGLTQGCDPSATSWTPLKGLSIFSGGGNLDRGLEEGGAVRFTHAVDMSREATHTQMANTRHPEDFRPYWGSVDDYLKAVLSGNYNKLIARIGLVQFIAAGSPCPGFSSMQRNWLSETSLCNASHITTFCSYVDVYRPEYAILENVVTMTNTRKGFEEEKVLSQLIACLVVLGYQVQHFLMDAWSYSSGQQRSRIFVSIAAPGLKSIPWPFRTHQHPTHIKNRSLGKLVNGQLFGVREFCDTPFQYRTTGDISGSLPDIGSGTVRACIPFPDHRVVWVPNVRLRALIECIPVSPPGQGYQEALEKGLVPERLRAKKSEIGKSYRRIQESGQFPTITTNYSAQDSRGGSLLHWSQNRTLTIMEARHAQGIPDHEIIVGSPAEQWKIIGNGVDRNVALALGLSLWKAWDASHGRALEPSWTLQEINYEIVDVGSDDERQSPIPTYEIVDASSAGSLANFDSDGNNSYEAVKVVPKSQPKANTKLQDASMPKPQVKAISRSKMTLNNNNRGSDRTIEDTSARQSSPMTTAGKRALPKVWGSTLTSILSLRTKRPREDGIFDDNSGSNSSSSAPRKKTRRSRLPADYAPTTWLG